MHVVEDDDDRIPPGEVGQRHGEGLQDLGPRRLSFRDGAPDHRHAAQQTGEVVQEPAADRDHLLGRERAQVTLEGLGPEPEGGGGPQRVATGREGEGPGTGTSHELGRQPGLPHSGVADKKGASELSAPRSGKASLQYGKLSRSSDEPGAAGPCRRVFLRAGARRPHGQPGRNIVPPLHGVGPLAGRESEESHPTVGQGMAAGDDAGSSGRRTA